MVDCWWWLLADDGCDQIGVQVEIVIDLEKKVNGVEGGVYIGWGEMSL